MTAYENILVPMEIAGAPDAAARARRLLDEVGLTDRGHHYPSQLSGGEQQRVALARALANDPPILLADEPTGNLDTANGRHILELLQGIHRARQTTLVLVTHDRELAAVAEARIVLRDGAVVEQTCAAELCHRRASASMSRLRWRSARRARRGGGCCSSSSALRSALRPSWRYGP